MNSRAKVVTFAILTAVLTWVALRVGNREAAQVSYTRFLAQVRAGQVASAAIEAGNVNAPIVRGQAKNGEPFRTVLPARFDEALSAMQEHAVDIRFEESYWTLLRNSLPFLLLLGFWIVLMCNRKHWSNLG